MSDFSTNLEKYIHKKGYTIQEFSALCDVNRTLMQKYLSGQRFPKNKELLHRMIQQLRLMPEEKKEFIQSWKKKYLGEDIYEQYQSIRAMLESFEEMVHDRKYDFNLSIETQLEIKMLKKTVPIFSKYMLISLMWKIIEYECTKKKANFYLICQMENDMMDNLMKHMVSQGNVSIHHLICLNANKEENQQYNIRLLNRIIPYICGKADYNVNFYYGDIKYIEENAFVLSCILLTEEYVFTFDENMKKGILYKDEEFWRFWMEIFQEKNTGTESFLTKHENILEAVTFYQNQQPCDISCQFQPCLAYSLSPEILHQVICPSMLGQQDIIEQFTSMMKLWGENALKHNKAANLNYFLASGVDDFLKTGRVAEFPSEFYTPIPVDMRYQMLEFLCNQMEMGLIDGHLINEAELKLDDSLVIQICGTEAVHFISCKSDGSQILMRITENSIVMAFREFLATLKDNDNALTKEETIAYIRDRLVQNRTVPFG